MIWEQSRLEKNDRNFTLQRRPKRIASNHRSPHTHNTITQTCNDAQRHPYAQAPMETAIA